MNPLRVCDGLLFLCKGRDYLYFESSSWANGKAKLNLTLCRVLNTMLDVFGLKS
jgi:hypothetical protein